METALYRALVREHLPTKTVRDHVVWVVGRNADDVKLQLRIAYRMDSELGASWYQLIALRPAVGDECKGAAHPDEHGRVSWSTI